MGIEENKEVVRQYIEEVLNNLDYTHAEELMHEEFFGEGGKIQGIEAHKKNFTAQREKLPDIRNDLLEMIAEGDKVVAVSVVSGTDVGGYFGSLPTNKKMEGKVIAIYTLKDGKIAKGDITYNLLTTYQQIGILPSTEEIIQAYNDSLG